MPIMLRSSYCALSGHDQTELQRLGECPYDQVRFALCVSSTVVTVTTARKPFLLRLAPCRLLRTPARHLRCIVLSTPLPHSNMPSMAPHSPNVCFCLTPSHRHTQGGYFVINGSEKVLIAQEKMSTNHVYVFQKKQPSKYSYTAEARIDCRETSRLICACPGDQRLV